MKTIMVIGMGAIGSHLLLALRNVGAVVRIADFDKVEAKNTLAQMHPKQHLGKNKATVSSKMYKMMFNKTVLATTAKITSDNIVQLMQGVDLVVDCTDNFVARELFNTYSKKNGIDCLHLAMDAEGIVAVAEWAEQFKPRPVEEEGATCEDGENLPFHMMIGAMGANIVQTYIKTGQKQRRILTHSNMH